MIYILHDSVVVGVGKTISDAIANAEWAGHARCLDNRPLRSALRLRAALTVSSIGMISSASDLISRVGYWAGLWHDDRHWFRLETAIFVLSALAFTFFAKQWVGAFGELSARPFRRVTGGGH